MPSVITIGTATRDVFLESLTFRAVRDRHFTRRAGFPTGEAECFALGSKNEVEKITLTSGGGATNAAVTFARQRIRTTCVMELGKDRIGDDIVHESKSEGVRPLAVRNKKLGTGYSTLLLAPGGERTVLVYRGASGDLTSGEISLNKLRADWVYIVPGTIGFLTIKRFVDYFYDRGSFIAMDPSSYYLKMGLKKLKPILNKMKLVKMNREEAALLTGKSFNDEKGIFEVFDKHVNGVAVMTEGPKGVIVSDGKYIYRARTFKEKVVADRTGAGDAFGSGFVASLIKSTVSNPRLSASTIKRDPRKSAFSFPKEAIAEAIRLASANATSVVEYIGAKQGILTARDFQNRRWRRLKVKVSRI